MSEPRVVFSYSEHALNPGAALDLFVNGRRLVVGTVTRCRYSEQAAMFVITSKIIDPDVIAAMALCVPFPTKKRLLCSV